MCYMIRCFLLLMFASPFASGSDAFIWPGNGVPADRPTWGHRVGLRIGLAPAAGPNGLVRIYAPHLDQEYPRMVNYLSVEPAVTGHPGRGQSELEESRTHPSQSGLTFAATNSLVESDTKGELPTGIHDCGAGTLRLFVHPEPFRNGAHPIIEFIFHRDQIDEVEIVIHAATNSAVMESCVISATMGNYGLLRELHLSGDRVARASELWSGEPLDHLGFLPWRVWPADDLVRTATGDYRVSLSSDVSNPASTEYSAAVPGHWRYRGRGATHYWRSEPDTPATVAVNARQTYWGTDALIPGGVSFENFELRMPFRDGQRLWFGVAAREGE